MKHSPEPSSLPQGRTRRLLMEHAAQTGHSLESDEPDALIAAIESLNAEGILNLLGELSPPASDSEARDDQRTRIQLDSALMKLEKADASARMQAESLSHLNHDVRGMMTGCLGMLELLGSTDLDEEQSRYVETMGGSAHSVLRILGDSLDYSKLDARALELRSAPLELPRLLEELVATHRPRAQAKALQLQISIQKEVPDWIEADETRLRQVIGNLLENALKFTSEGEVVLSAEVRGTKADGPAELAITVSDTGIGIANERLPEVFHPYVQIQRGVGTGGFQGVGLGLAIVKNLVSLMGGSVDATSRLGEGTRFKIALPLNVVAVAETEEAPLASASAPGSRRSVLVVEDDVVNQTFTAVAAERLGFDVHLAANGKEAVELASLHFYDAILMDIAMPVMDGMEATRQIRALDFTQREARIIAVTGHVFEQDQQKYREAGMDGFLAKPFGMKDLEQALEKAS